jgi:phage baseplate assembly protein W
MDIATTINGDILRENGAIRQLSIAELINQRINLILRSKPGDWSTEPGFGAYIAKYVGYPNIPATKQIIEEEIMEALQRDKILSNFSLNVEYTPTSLGSALVEISVTLPDGNVISMYKEMSPVQGINTNIDRPYTPPRYDTNIQVIMKELVTLQTSSNTFEVSRLPLSSNIFILEYNDSLSYDTDGNLIVAYNTINLEYDYTSSIPSGALDYRTVEFESGTISVLSEKLIDNVNVEIDGTPITVNDYTMDSDSFYLRPEYTTLVGSTKETYGVAQDLSGSILTLQINYYDSIQVLDITSTEQDSVPTLFPKSRILNKNYITTKNTYPAGTYIVQYTTYEIGD